MNCSARRRLNNAFWRLIAPIDYHMLGYFPAHAELVKQRSPTDLPDTWYEVDVPEYRRSGEEKGELSSSCQKNIRFSGKLQQVRIQTLR